MTILRILGGGEGRVILTLTNVTLFTVAVILKLTTDLRIGTRNGTFP
jgi:hypothetical protein